MSAQDPAKSFQSLLKKLRSQYGAEPAEALAVEPGGAADALTHQLVFGFLLWDASTTQAKSAFKRIGESFVDYNELRISLPGEIAAALGERHPLAAERAARLKATLQDVYRREHAITLAHVADASKRDARQYLESLDGMPGFVAARLIVFGLGGHAIPADQRLVDLLRGERAIPADDASVEDAPAWLERQVRANEAAAVASVLQAWSDDKGSTPRRERASPTLVLTPAQPGEPRQAAAKRPRPGGKSAPKRPAERAATPKPKAKGS